MSFTTLTAGKSVPNDVNVIIEIAAQSGPVKYEVDKTSGTLHVDRFLSTAMFYPCNYGYIPQTLSEDGDPVDALVVTPHPLLCGSVIRCRPLGMLEMEDEAGKDNKLIMVPITKLTSLYEHAKSYQDLPSVLLKSVAHFFEHYKDLEKGKWVKVREWHGVEAACTEITQSMARYEKG